MIKIGKETFIETNKEGTMIIIQDGPEGKGINPEYNNRVFVSFNKITEIYHRMIRKGKLK